MKKYYLATNLQKEEDWINQIQARGYRLTGVNWFGRYTFEKRDKDSFFPTVRIDFHQNMSQDDYMDYLRLFADSGWVLLRGSQQNGNCYFQRTQEAKEDIIFSDENSQQALYQRYRTAALQLFGIAILNCTTMFLIFRNNTGGGLLNPSTWFVSTEPWVKTGDPQWYIGLVQLVYFLFHSPILPFLLLLLALLSLYIAIKARSSKKEVG